MTLALAAPVLVALSLGAGDGSGPRLDVKPGLWETKHTSTTKMDGEVPARDTSRLSPAQRAQVEKALERFATGKPHTVVRRSCLTQAELDKGVGLDDPRDQPQGCERRFLDRTSRHVRFELTCAKQDGMGMHGTYDVVVKSPELVEMKGDSSMNMPGRGGSSHMEMTSRRLGASCGDLKPGESQTVSK
ncbi:MAG TPA: DUF3617 domain-containing protein [Anaeromyxobacter sp.]